MHQLLNFIIPYATDTLELIGVIIIIMGGIKGIYELIASRFDLDNINLKLDLAKSLELGLEFKLAAEILKTVIIHTLDEILILSAVVILRVIMTFVIHWEIKNTEREVDERHKN